MLRRPQLRRFGLLAGAAAACLSTTGTDAQPGMLGALDAREPITYFIAEGDPGSQYRESDRDLAIWAFEAWERAANGAVAFRPAEESAASIRVYWVPASAGQYGEMRPLLVDGRRGAAVYIRPDVAALGPDIARSAAQDPLLRDSIVYLTCLHELGHALGLAHTAEYADVMYFFGFGGDVPAFFGRFRDRLRSRGDIASASGLSAGDAAQLEALYGAGAPAADVPHP